MRVKPALDIRFSRFGLTRTACFRFYRIRSEPDPEHEANAAPGAMPWNSCRFPPEPRLRPVFVAPDDPVLVPPHPPSSRRGSLQLGGVLRAWSIASHHLLRLRTGKAALARSRSQVARIRRDSR